MAEQEDLTETEINLQTVCRTCLTENGDMRSMFFSDDSIGNNSFSNIVTSCTQLRVAEGDGMPIHVCFQCIESVTMAFAFKQQAQRADATLRDYIVRKHPDIKLGPNAEVKLERSQDCIEIDVKTETKNAESTYNEDISFDDNVLMEHFDDSDDSEDDKKPLNAFKKEMEGKKLLNDLSNSQTQMTGLSCPICSKVFRTSVALEVHKEKRHPEGYVQCEYCNRRFTKEIYLERHMVATHSKALKQSKRSHEKRLSLPIREKSPEHTGPFVCKFCGYLFQREDQLVTHITLSHDEKCGPKKRGRPSKKDIIAKKLRLKGILETMKIKTEVDDEPTEEFDHDQDSFSTDPKEVLDELASGPIVNIQMEMGMEIFREKSTDHHYCNMCCKSFETFQQLEKHLRRHIGEKPSICRICDTTFTRMNLLKKHLQIHNTPDCLKDIDVKYKSALLTNHEKVLGVPAESLTDEFLSQVILDDIKSGKVERYINEIKIDHDELHILNDVENDSNDTGIDKGDSDSELKKKRKNGRHTTRKYKMHKCALCDQSFSRTNHIIRHMATHNYDYPYKCETCKKVFPNDEILQKHKRMQCENNSKAYQCGTCEMKFTYEMSLNRHILRYHKGESVLINFHDPMDKREKSFICPKCNKGFYRQENLDKHAKTHMPHEKKFECPICQKKFLRKDNLRTHSRIHEPKREDLESHCLCVYCGRSFSNSSNLIVHMRRHTGEKPYKCDICQKGFPRSSDLQCHRRTHTGEKPCLCTICGKGFSRSNKLVRHMRIHTGQRPYKCTFCDRAFTQSNDLTLHVRRHTGDKPYVCGICGDRFIQGTALQNHRRMQGHYEEVNMPTPFGATSVNNPSRENGANRVARVGTHVKAEIHEFLPDLKGLIPTTLI